MSPTLTFSVATNLGQTKAASRAPGLRKLQETQYLGVNTVSNRGAMARKANVQEPLLNSVARKLGHAAGTLANLTHGLAKDQNTTDSKSKSEVTKSEVSKQSSENKANNAANLGQKTTRRHHAQPKKRASAATARSSSGQNTTRTRRGSRRKV